MSKRVLKHSSLLTRRVGVPNLQHKLTRPRKDSTMPGTHGRGTNGDDASAKRTSSTKRPLLKRVKLSTKARSAAVARLAQQLETKRPATKQVASKPPVRKHSRSATNTVPRATRAQVVKSKSATKKSDSLTLKDRLSRLTYERAVQLLGEHGAKLISAGARRDIDLQQQVIMLQKELLLCRMAADSTVLVNKERPGFSSKLAVIDDLIERLFQEDGRKSLVFSEWTTMLDLIEPILKKHKLPFVRLDGSVPQKQCQALVHEFQTNPDCKLFLTTNAGSTGLNLQAANTVINVDLPWNPAVLEQRVARAYRMGQKNPVDVYILVTEDTLEERLLATLAAKQDLALAALDSESEVDEVHLASGMEELKRRLEVLLGSRAEAHVDESVRREERSDTREFAPEQFDQSHDNNHSDSSPVNAHEVAALNAHDSSSHEVARDPANAGGFAIASQVASPEQAARRERVSAAGGQLLAGAVALLGELLPSRPETEASRQLADSLKQGLVDCVHRDEQGQAKLTFTLPDPSVLNHLADSLAKLLARG